MIFKQANISSTITISLFMELYLNVIEIKAHDLSNIEVKFYNSVPMEPNNLFQDFYEKKCLIHNPQLNEVCVF